MFPLQSIKVNTARFELGDLRAQIYNYTNGKEKELGKMLRLSSFLGHETSKTRFMLWPDLAH